MRRPPPIDRSVVLATLALLLCLGGGPTRGQPLPAVPRPLALCSKALDAAWQAVDDGDAPSAARYLDAAAGISDCSLLDTRAARAFLEGRIRLLEGQAADALGAFERAHHAPVVRAGDRPPTAEILYFSGLTREALGQAEAAQATYAQLVRDHPADAHLAAVLPLLDAPPSSSPQERLDAALRAIEAHNYSAAERILTQVVADLLGAAVDPSEPAFGAAVAAQLVEESGLLGEVAFQLGYLWYYWIRVKNPQAIPLFSAVADSPHSRREDAAYYLARAFMRAEDYDRASTAWTAFAERYPRDRRGHEAAYYRGWLHLDREEFAEAIPGFEAYLDRFPRGDRRDRAVWYLGWAHFRLGRYAEARRFFSRMAAEGGYLFGAKGRYWEGRCYLEEGEHAQARAAFTEVAERYDFTYYGLLARQRLGWPLAPERYHTIPISPDRRLRELGPDHPRIDTLRQLIELGNPFHVARYHENAHPGRRLDSELDRLLVQHAAGDAYDDFRETRGRSHASLRRPPDGGSLLHWVRRFPRPYSHWVEAAGDELGVDPLLIWSHMQIESHYNPRFVSYADAQGLLQLIPRTGQRVAAALDEPYTEGMLMHPAINLRYGTWYLAALLNEFGNQLPLAITAYNAGGGAVHRWVAENHELPFDAFVEEIPYDQSREYLKRVIGIYAHYLFLYGDDEALGETLPRLLPDRIDPDAIRGVIDW